MTAGFLGQVAGRPEGVPWLVGGWAWILARRFWPLKLSLPLAGIPTLIVLDPQGEVITRQGRVEVLNDEDCREFPWHPKPVLELSDSNAAQLNEGPCLVLFVGRKPQRQPRGGLDMTDLRRGCPPTASLLLNNAEPGPLSLPRLSLRPCF